MASTDGAPAALIVSGDARIEKLLRQEGTVVIPALACRFDGFANDTFSEYANASICRPSSVRSARLVSTVQDTVYRAGTYYFGFTMYVSDGSESVEMWIGHRQVAVASVADPDNRVHLFFTPEPFRFRGGEPVRLITAPTSGTYRIENLVLLPRKPRPTEERLEIREPHVDLRFGQGGALQGHVTWITNRPATGTLQWGKGKSLRNEATIAEPTVNHEVLLESLKRDEAYRYRIELSGGGGRLSTRHEGTFRTAISPPRSKWKKERVPLPLRRKAHCPMLWPVSVGVPFPEGALGSDREIRLVDASRAEIPMQARTRAEWPDGSVKWALVDFQADAKRDLALECGSQVERSSPEGPLEVSDRPDGITVATGPMHVEFPRNRLVFPGIISLRQKDGSYRRLTRASPSAGVGLTDAAGNAYRSGKPDAVVLEEAGPERVCVRLETRHRSAKTKTLFRSVFRVHVSRDSSALRVLHTFENNETGTTFTNIREMQLRADLDLGGSPEAGIEGVREIPVKKSPLELRQSRDDQYRIKQGKKAVGKGRRAHGTAQLSGDAASASVVVKNFWQNYPKGLRVDESGISIEICPPLDRGAYRTGDELEDRLYYHLLGGTYKLKHGVSRTHEIWFHFQTGRAVPPKGFSKCVQSPPLYSVSLGTFNKSDAITQLPSKEKSPYPPFEAWVEAAHGAYPKDREKWHSYGMLNFGDWFGERTYNWGNHEYDTAWCFLQEYLRGGHPDFYTWAEEAVGHLVDVDTCHCSPNPSDLGGQYAHCVGHVGGYFPDGYREQAIFSGHFTVSHYWVEGSFLYHLLSGDARALEGAMKTSDRLAGATLNYYDFTNCRNSGWHLIHLSAAYKTTGRRVYLNAARIIVERVLERQRDTGGWDRLMVPGHCFCDPPRHTGNAGFMVGVLMVGMKRYYEATGDERVAESIVRAAGYCIDHMWVPETRSFRYTCCPHSGPGGGADMRILKGVAFAWHHSRKKRFREILLQGIETALAGRPSQPRRGLGKSICSPMRGAYQVLGELPGPASS